MNNFETGYPYGDVPYVPSVPQSSRYVPSNPQSSRYAARFGTFCIDFAITIIIIAIITFILIYTGVIGIIKYPAPNSIKYF